MLGKRSRLGLVPQFSATRGSGVPIGPEYEAAVEQLRALSIVAPGRERPVKRSKSLTAAAVQHRRHASWCPPGFELTREIRTDKRKFFDAARKLRHPFAGAEDDLPEDVQAAVDAVAAKLHSTPVWREEQMARFRKIAESLEPMSARMRKQQRPHVAAAAGQAHPAFMMALSDAMEWPDIEFARRFCLIGFDVVGSVKDTGLYRRATKKEVQKKRAAGISVPTLCKGNAQWARQLKRQSEETFASARAQGGKRLAAIEAAWERSVEETGPEKGTAEGPFTFDEVDERFGYGKWCGALRFAVEQGEKWRPCDNFRRTNRAYESPERLTMTSPLYSAMVGRRLARAEAAAGGWDFEWSCGVATDDEPDAYRGSAVFQPQFTPAVVCDPASGKRIERELNHVSRKV